MKQYIPFLVILTIGISCSRPEKKKTVESDNNNFGLISAKIIDVTKAYLANQLKNPVITIDNFGAINLKSEGITYVVTAKDINIGLIDEDNSQDAIVTYLVVPKGQKKFRKQLILLNKGEVKVVRDFASELRVMQISNRTIFGELPKYGPSSPLNTCNECKENVKYKLVSDSLQLIN